MASKAKKAFVLSMESMREIFDDSQRLDKHNSCLNQLIALQTISSRNNQTIKEFYREFVRNLKFTLWVPDSRSPYTQNTIAFIIRYLLTFRSSDDCPPNIDNEELRHEFIDTVLEDVIIPYTNSLKPECRINACHFIRRLADEMDDISEDIFDKIRKALLDRSADRMSAVRAAAILALHRFQDGQNANDLVSQAIHFHLNYDPDHDVRNNCLKAMAASPTSLTHFIGATRDIKDFIRKTAYIQISDNRKLQIKCFTIEQRLTILKNGLKDRSPAVRKVVESVLIPSWVKSCNNDLIELLIALDIQTDIELIEKMLEIYFNHLNREKVDKDSNETQFERLVHQFRDKNLSKERIFKVSLNVENVFLWRFLSEFCKTNRIECKVEKTDEPIEQTVTEEVTEDNTTIDPKESTNNDNEDNTGTKVKNIVENMDLFEQLVPEVPYFCTYLEKFLQNLITPELSATDALDFEFIYKQFMKVSLLLDIGDDVQRKILISMMRSILIDNQIGDKFDSYITPVMKCLAKNGFADNNSFLDFTADIISEIFASILENDSIIDDSNRELEDKKEKILKDIEKYELDLKELESEGKHTEMDEMSQTIKDLNIELICIKEKIANNTLLSQSSQSSQTPPSFEDHPKLQMRCLQIFSGCLEFGDFSEVNAVMQTHIEKVCLSGFLSDNVKIRVQSTRCLGLVCLSSPQYFKKYLYLLIEIFSKDVESVKLIAIQSIFDSLCEHGINIFDDKLDSNDDNTNDIRLQMAFQDTDEDFITSLKQFFETQLDSEFSEIRETTVKGVAKLLIHCRIYSPELLSKLIIIWFTPDENQVLIQFIGDFLRMYSLAESQGVIVGQSALEEAFFLTLETLSTYEKHLKTINTENLIKFFLNLIVDENHPKLALEFAKRIVELESIQSKLGDEYLLSAISQLNLIEMESKDLKCFEEYMKTISLKLENSKAKNVKKKLSQIINKIEIRRQQLTADSAFAEDFAPIDDIDGEDVNQTIETNTTFDFEIKSPESGSDAESYKTCPESPVHKKRKLSEKSPTNEPSDDVLAAEPSDDVLVTELSDDVLATEPSDDVLVTEPSDDVLATEPSDDVLATEPSDDVLPTESSDVVSRNESTVDVLANELIEENSETNIPIVTDNSDSLSMVRNENYSQLIDESVDQTIADPFMEID